MADETELLGDQFENESDLPPDGPDLPGLLGQAGPFLVPFVLAISIFLCGAALLFTYPLPTGKGKGGSADTQLEDMSVRILTLNLNTATALQLEALPGIGPKLAESILARRNELNGFSATAELSDIPGIGEKTLNDILPYVFVGEFDFFGDS